MVGSAEACANFEITQYFIPRRLTRIVCVTDFTGNADMPYDFFLSRYNEAYVTETIAFCESLVNDTPVPCTGEDGLVALIMALAADKSAEENRWVSFREVSFSFGICLKCFRILECGTFEVPIDTNAHQLRIVGLNSSHTPQIVEQVYCSSPTECELLAASDVFPEGFKPTSSAKELLLPSVDEQKEGKSLESGMKKMFSNLFG